MTDRVFWATLIAILACFNGALMQKERLLQSGEKVYLELGVRDPRSLMQGDYMVLFHPIGTRSGPGAGRMVVRLDERGVASFVRLHAGEIVSAPERLLRYRRPRSWNDNRVGARTFFFEEGMAKVYERARFAEYRVDPDGEAVLVALCDESLGRLGSERVRTGESLLFR